MKSIISSVISVFMAVAASTCCVGPFMALAGMIGVSASSLIWLSSIKNYLIAFSLIAISYNLYRAYFPKQTKSCCNINELNLDKNEKRAVFFFQSKIFLWGIAILTIVILLLPYLHI